MINQRKARFSLLLVTAIFCCTASSEEDKFASVRATLQTCFVCHGENGASTQSSFPILAGQEFYYLYVQLKDMKSGLRAGTVMAPLVAGIKKADLRLMARFFSEQKWPETDYQFDATTKAAGRKAADAGQCVACHLGTYTGNSRVPRVANQHPDYLNQTMLDFKNDIRKNAPSIAALFVTYSDEEIKTMADYLAGFKE